jgi:RHS repeat-associated protein
MVQAKVSGCRDAAAGNLVQWPGGTATIGAEYDVEGRMSRVTRDGSVVEQHFYDEHSRRVKSGNTLQFYGLGGELLGEYERVEGQGAPRMVRERVYFAGLWVGTVEGDGSWSMPNTDRLGSLKQGSRRYPFGDGNESYAYDEYATYRRDHASAHYYAWNRYYSATWGRFSSPDPYVMSGGLTNPQGWNRYSYVANDPVNFHDPDGLWAQPPSAPGFCPPGYSYADCIRDGVFRPGGGLGGTWDWCRAAPDYFPILSMPDYCRPLIGLMLVEKGGGGSQDDKVNCTVELWYRPLDLPATAGLNHAFLRVSTTIAGVGTTWDQIEGGPQNDGDLVNPGNLIRRTDYYPKKSNPELKNNKRWATVTSHTDPELCDKLFHLYLGVVYVEDHPVKYNAIDGPNSNSYINFLLRYSKITTDRLFAPPGTWAWGVPLYP